MVQRGAVTAAWCDRLLDGTVVLLATWTVVYHACLLLRLGTTWALGLEAITLAAVVLVARRTGPDAVEVAVATTPPLRPATTHRWAGRAALPVTLGAAPVAALAMALDAPWPLVWVPWLVASLAGSWWAIARLHDDGPGPDEHTREPTDGTSTGTAVVALAWALGLAVLATFILRPNPDDLYYLNLSQWVAEHGTFPLRDTLFADLVYPMSNWPPVASYDGLVGVVARVVGVRAGTVGYVAVPPIATALSVLALWRLLRCWRAQRVAWVLSAALVFLLIDGTSSYGTPGNLFLTRLWQGKTILLCLMVPLLLVQATRYVELPTRRGALRLLAVGAASVALSTTALFLVPVVAVTAMAPLALRSPRRALVGFAAMAGYPLAGAVLTKVVGGRSADTFGARRQYRFDAAWIGHEIFLTGPVAAVAVLAVLCAALLVPHRAMRVTSSLAAVVMGLVLVPGATRIAYEVTGLGPTLWRLSWGCTVAALVGLGTVRVVGLLPRRAAAPAALVALALAVGYGSPIWAAATNSRWQRPFHWQRSHSSLATARAVLSATRPGDVVLAPDPLAITIAVTTTATKTVAPRDYYMYYLRHDPRFHYRERLTLVNFVNNEGSWSTRSVLRAARVVGVDAMCLDPYDVRRLRALTRAGYVPLVTTSTYRCLAVR